MSAVKVVAIDLDGTLLPETSVSLELARWTGHADLLHDLERQYARGEISNKQIADETVRYLAGKRLGEVDEILDRVPTLQNIALVVARISTLGHHCVLASVTWHFAVGFYARKFGFPVFSGTKAEVREGVLSGYVTEYFDENDKADFVRRHCDSLGIPMTRCMAIGDSRSDLPLFRLAGSSIAVNSRSDELGQIAKHSVTADDLAELLPYIETWLGTE